MGLPRASGRKIESRARSSHSGCTGKIALSQGMNSTRAAGINSGGRDKGCPALFASRWSRFLRARMPSVILNRQRNW